jgi:para-nitrobenzyl esterase
MSGADMIGRRALLATVGGALLLPMLGPRRDFHTGRSYRWGRKRVRRPLSFGHIPQFWRRPVLGFYGNSLWPRRAFSGAGSCDEAEQLRGDVFGPACPQAGETYRPQSEDCLFLNVWTPDIERPAKRPVMVYFHGGAYSTGSVTDPVNDGAKLAARGDVVVVTVNHRLNALGYLYLARLDPRFPDSGNAGQLDLILALMWVQRNIAAFGGDPGNVTLFGQSGGGAKIATLMAMPEAKGLFHKAITMSGQQVTASGPLNATKRAQAFLDKLGPGVDPATAPVSNWSRRSRRSIRSSAAASIWGRCST